MPPSEDRVVGVVEEKGGSGIWDGGGVVVRCPAEPMQHEVNDCWLKTKTLGKSDKSIQR